MHTLNDIMGKAPAVDDTNGAGVADVASGKKFWGLTSGAWGLQTGTRAIAPVPKTGQTNCYDVSSNAQEPCAAEHNGQDAYEDKGVSWPSPRFTDDSTGVITDTLTGLVWLANANCAVGVATWANALSYANALYDGCSNCFNGHGDCGLSDGSIAGDWRLPNVRELHSLIDFSQDNPALPIGYGTYFTGVQQSSYYWSSTTNASVTTVAWYVYLGYGSVDGGGKTNNNSYYVWPVRGGQ